MMMTEKYYTLPPPLSSSSSSSTPYCYSTIYHSIPPLPHTTTAAANRIREIKNRLDLQKNNTQYHHYMNQKKLLDDEIENNSKEKTSSSTTTDTLQSVIANTLQQTLTKTESYGSALSRTMMNSTVNGHMNGKRRSLSGSHIGYSNDTKRSNRYCSLLSKRVRTYSLSNHSTMAITATTSFSEEQNTEPQETTSIDYENTYFYPEETTRLDDVLSLTTITPNIPAKVMNTQLDVSVYSDTTVSQSDVEENSEEIISIVKQQYGDICQINMTSDSQNETIKNNDDQIIEIKLNLTPPERDFTGVVHARKCTVVKENECLSDYDNVNHSYEQDNLIRSKVDNVSINKSIDDDDEEHCPRISTDEQLYQQEKQTNHDDNSNKINQQSIVHSINMNNDIDMVTEQDIAHDDADDEEHYSDESNCSDDLRYSSDPARNSCASDDLNNTSSTLRQEAISITKVRCKRRKTWIRSPSSPTSSTTNNNRLTNSIQHHRLKTNLIQPFLSTNQVDGTDARQNANVNLTIKTATTTSNIHKSTRVKTNTTAMLLHNHLLNSNNNKIKNGEIHSDEFITSNIDHNYQHSINNHYESSLLKTSTSFDKDVSSIEKPNQKLNDFYQSSALSPVKRLLNESLDSNVEIIQVDEQECILEIVDGVLTIVPKDKSVSSSSSASSIDIIPREQIEISSSQQYPKQRLSSIASSLSTPSLSEQEQEQEQEREDLISISSTKAFTHIQELSTLKPYSSPLPSSSSSLQIEQSMDVLDLFATPNNSTNNNNRNSKNLLDESLSSVSSYGDRPNEMKKSQTTIPRSSSPINQKKKSSLIKDISQPSIENQTRTNKSTLLTELLQTVKKSSPNEEIDIEKPQTNSVITKTDLQPTPKPINKDRINEFASLLSSSVHLSQPQVNTKSSVKSTKKSSPKRSKQQNSSSITTPTISNNSEQEPTKRHIDARYNERLDDRGTIKIKTANIKALFEQKITDTNKSLSQSNEHLLHVNDNKSQHKQHKKVPVSYESLKKNSSNYQPTVSNNKRNSYQDSSTMNKYNDHISTTKDVVIEDKQPINGYGNHTHRHTNEQINRSTLDSSTDSTNGYYSETLLAREIRETKEKEEELKRQRKKCGLNEDNLSSPSNSIKSESTHQSMKSNTFLSNLDFFTSKLNGSSNESTSTIVSPPRRSISNVIPDSSSSVSSSNPSRQSSIDELKTMTNVVSQELNRFNENGVPIIRTSSTNGLIQRSSSNQNILSTQNAYNNIIQREIEIIRAKEAELRQLGRIQHTSDEHADPRKYQELISTLPKSQSVLTIPTGKKRRDSENQHLLRQNSGPVMLTPNGFSKPKTNNNLVRSKFPSSNPTAPVVSSSNKPTDYSKLSSVDRLELEKRQCQEREQELKKQRNSISVSTSSTNTTINGDSGNVSQEEHDDDQERYFDKIERLKRTENEKAQAPLIRPTKKSGMSQKWEQMMATKIDD